MGEMSGRQNDMSREAEVLARIEKARTDTPEGGGPRGPRRGRNDPLDAIVGLLGGLLVEAARQNDLLDRLYKLQEDG